MAKVSSPAFDKIQTSTLMALGHLYDKSLELINDELKGNFVGAPSDSEQTDEQESLPPSPKLKGLSQHILDTYKQHLMQIKSSASAELRKTYSLISEPQSRKLSTTAFEDLELISFDEMELQIVLTHFDSTLTSHFQLPLAMLSMRFEHICQRELSLTRLPISPTMLGRTLLNSIKTLDLSVEEKRSLYIALLTALKNVYRPLLEQTNKLFIQYKVLPNLSKDDISVKQQKEKHKQQADKKRKELLGIDEEEKASSQINHFLQELKIPSTERAHQIFSKKDAPIIPKQVLAEKIDLLHSTPDYEDNGIYRKVNTDKTLAQQLIQKADIENYGLSNRANKTISLISMAFDQLFSNQNVPDAIKALLTQLQAPLLKAAVQDDMFLADMENPAQKFVNSIAEASVTWSPEQNPNNDRLYKKMTEMVDKVTNDFDDDYLIFDEAITDFTSFKEQEEEKTAQVETRIVDRETAQARLQKARQIASQHIDRKFGGLNLPSNIQTFVYQTWQQVLFFIYNKEHSKESSAWQDAIEIENGLLTNLKHKQTEDVATFLIVLREKLQDCGIAANEIDSQLSVLTQAFAEDHSDALANLDINSADTNTDDEVNATQALQQDDVALLEKISVGTWLQKNDSTPPVKIKVAAHVKFNDSYIMVLRNGMKDSTFSSAQLVEKIKNKQLELLNQLSFESALESVISGIR